MVTLVGGIHRGCLSLGFMISMSCLSSVVEFMMIWSGVGCLFGGGLFFAVATCRWSGWVFGSVARRRAAICVDFMSCNLFGIMSACANNKSVGVVLRAPVA